MKQIAVLLTVHNRRENTLQCLHNLFAQDKVEGYTFDVWLTDDGCTDGTAEAVEQAYPEVHIIKGDGNLFWNRGMYKAWEAAASAKDYDYFLWLNDDTYTYPYMLKELLLLSEEKDNQGIVIGATESLDCKKVTYGGRSDNGCVLIPVGESVEVNHFNGNIVLIPFAVYQILGNLDYYFTHSKGDFDYGLRAKKQGIRMWQVGRFLGRCDLHPSLDKWCNPDISFSKRWAMLHRPNGMPPKETFHLERRHYGLFTASTHFCSIYLRCLWPKLWIRLGKA